jgi:hypothetical protein
MPGIACDLSETIGPVVAAPGKDLGRRVSDMDLHAVAVELDLMNPTLAARNLFSIEVARAGAMNPGKGALMPTAGGFGRE